MSNLDPDFEVFEKKIEEINSIVKGLCSKDENISKKASMKADLYLHETKDFDEETLKIKTTRTVINKYRKNETQETMTKDAFMASVEKDAKQRSEDRKRRYAIANSYKKSANEAFTKGDYIKAVDLYTKAITEVKDCANLYINRAVSYLKLGLYKKIIEDCDWALRVDDNYMRAWLLKARAHCELGDLQETDKCIQEAIKKHPNRKNEIDMYVAQWRWKYEKVGKEDDALSKEET